VTTLLSKEGENRAQQSAAAVSGEQLAALREAVSAQGGKVKDAKVVSALVCGFCGAQAGLQYVCKVKDTKAVSF
jgi:hypothetical protein